MSDDRVQEIRTRLSQVKYSKGDIYHFPVLDINYLVHEVDRLTTALAAARQLASDRRVELIQLRAAYDTKINHLKTSNE
jgi:hypothetical protein